MSPRKQLQVNKKGGIRELMSKLVPRRMDRVPMINIEVLMYNSNLAQKLGSKRHVCRCLIVFLQGPGTFGFGDVKLHW